MRIILALTLISIVALLAVPSVFAADASAPENKEQKERQVFDNLENFYRLGLSLVGISALFMIVWGGVLYVIAGDSTSKVEQGKQKIKNALIGILIAGASFALLNTINPDLVKRSLEGTPPNPAPAKK